MVDGEYMAIIKNIGFGLRDTDAPCIFFEARTLNMGSVQVLFGDAIPKFVREWDVYDIRSIEGNACIVEVKSNIMKYKRRANI